ncbi:uncharacterized protein LOC114537514 [Dendronephthya gigantea]|uniref:uncharacterized protein LOC114537514 n=1 Tax=Dendronephthya gigantea TaxID=151771 RepID=UPI00106AEE2E|nr:uncharacterized protein LOC114537514 [Dendronephthya gigantea]
MNPIVRQILDNIDHLSQQLRGNSASSISTNGNESAVPGRTGGNVSGSEVNRVADSVSNEVSQLFGTRRATSSNNNSTREGAGNSSSSAVGTPRFQLAHNFGRRRNSGKKKDKPIVGPFLKDVVLLSGPLDDKVPRQGTRVWLMENKHILSGVQFQKEWDNHTLLSFIKSLFPSKLIEVDIEIPMPVHFKLVPPTLAPGQALTGYIVQKIFKDKPIYVRPATQIIQLSLDDSEPDLKRDRLDDQEFEEYAMHSSWGDDAPAVEPESSSVISEIPNEVEVIASHPKPEAELEEMGTPSSRECLSLHDAAAFEEVSESAALSVPTPSSPIVEVICVDESSTIDEVAKKCIDYCKKRKIEDPIEILRVLQQFIVTGRQLDIQDPSDCLEGDTNYILVNRQNVLASAMEEIEPLMNPRLTLEVCFYGEVAADMGGPRREFFRLCLQEIKSRYFDDGLKEHLANEYTTVGLIMALSILQNGAVPRFLSPNDLQDLFTAEKPSTCLENLRCGFAKLGLHQIGKALPTFLFLLHPSEAKHLSRRMLLHILSPKFSEEGSNARTDENIVYQAFLKYVQATASGRRGSTSLNHILQFVTGADEEPPLGFCPPPSIIFVSVDNDNLWEFVPTVNSCANILRLPRCVSGRYPLPDEEKLFELYDTAFANAYFGRM